MSWSLWERDIIRPRAAVIVVGGGITGLSAGYFLREKNPALDVLVLDRSDLSTGASTRNAGFACMGSLGELVDDAQTMGHEAVTGLYRRRYEGLQLLQQIVPPEEMDLHWCGGYELFGEGQEAEWAEVTGQLEAWNERIRAATGIERAFEVVGEAEWDEWRPRGGMGLGAIRHAVEGRLHPGKMMRGWRRQLKRVGGRFYGGVAVVGRGEAKDGGVRLVDELGREWEADRVVWATNGFVGRIFPEVKVKPARNQVLVTGPLDVQIPDACFHYNKGYVYFRRCGAGILIGGGRHLDPEGETTDRLGTNERLIGYLKDFTGKHLTEGPFEEVAQWSGIMGVGPEKMPIVEWIDERQVMAVRLSGMGVALGTAIGRRVAELITERND
jgi:gamma-glutamylputrescine oxidase